MSRSKLLVASWVLFASLVLVLGLIGWLQGVSPFRVAQAAGLIDDSFADFTGGTGCYVRSSGVGGLDGEVIVTATVNTDFPGSALPAGWVSTPALAATVNGGQLIVDDGTADASVVSVAGQTLEFSATFSGPHIQFIGFSDNINFTGNYAIFGTTNANDGHLYARATGVSDIDLGTGLLGSLHRFRIEWGTASITYTVFTDTLGTSDTYVQSATLPGPMSLMVQDSNSAGITLTVDWARLWPWACTYTSHVFNSGLAGTSFTGLSTTLSIPSGTAIAFEIITSTNGIDWGGWTTINVDGTFISSTAPYLRYRSALSAPNALVTPEVQFVQVRGVTPTVVRLTSFEAARSDSAFGGWLGVFGGGVLILGIICVILRRKDNP